MIDDSARLIIKFYWLISLTWRKCSVFSSPYMRKAFYTIELFLNTLCFQLKRGKYDGCFLNNLHSTFILYFTHWNLLILILLSIIIKHSKHICQKDSIENDIDLLQKASIFSKDTNHFFCDSNNCDVEQLFALKSIIKVLK